MDTASYPHGRRSRFRGRCRLSAESWTEAGLEVRYAVRQARGTPRFHQAIAVLTSKINRRLYIHYVRYNVRAFQMHAPSIRRSTMVRAYKASASIIVATSATQTNLSKGKSRGACPSLKKRDNVSGFEQSTQSWPQSILR